VNAEQGENGEMNAEYDAVHSPPFLVNISDLWIIVVHGSLRIRGDLLFRPSAGIPHVLWPENPGEPRRIAMCGDLLGGLIGGIPPEIGRPPRNDVHERTLLKLTPEFSHALSRI